MKKLNNKGFAITTILYGTLILFLLLIVSSLGILSTYKLRMDKLINANNGARSIINGEYTVTNGEYTVTIRYKTNGGTITKNTDVWSSDSEGLIYKNGKIFEHVYNYNDSLYEDGLQNWNDPDNLFLENEECKEECKVIETKEWVCLEGDCDNNTTYDHAPTSTTGYTPSTFCDATTNGSCMVILGVNWQ